MAEKLVTKLPSDHKPLQTIVRKPLLSAPKRLQRMMVRIKKYDLDVVYVPGKHMLLTDTLSRAYLPECSCFISASIEPETANMVQHFSEDRLHAIRTATKEDKTLQVLIETMCHGWSKDKAMTPSKIQPPRWRSIHSMYRSHSPTAGHGFNSQPGRPFAECLPRSLSALFPVSPTIQ